MSADAIISFDNVSMKYGDLTALDRISFDLREGEIFGYIGPNGAGKTTTIKIIVGLIRDFEGGYRAMGKDAAKDVTPLQGALGYLPQHVAFQEWQTVDHALRTFGELSGLVATIIEERMQSLLQLLDLMGVQYRKISELSGGTVQKIGLAQALLHQPRVLVLDEPLSGLDPAGRGAVKLVMKQVSRGGTTIFFSSHILSDVQDVADRIGIISSSRILKVGTMASLRSHLSPVTQYEVHIAGNIQDAMKRLRLPAGASMTRTGTDCIILDLEQSADLDSVADAVFRQLLSMNYHIRCFKPIDTDLDQLFLRYVTEAEIS